MKNMIKSTFQKHMINFLHQEGILIFIFSLKIDHLDTKFMRDTNFKT
jgi:hypothetical protein